MILNGFPVDPDRLKIVILSAPKTGNIWLRWLLHYEYAIPIVELPLEWAPGCADDLPPSFVTHQHLFPSESLVQWLVESRAVVLTTIRHRAATFLSLFHYVKWHDPGSDPSFALLKQDGDRPGKNALKYHTYSFPQSYAISLAWPKLGSHVVRYEDLLVDPLSQLREVTSKIVPLDEDRLKAAVFLCEPEQLKRVIDPRFLSICLRSKAPRVVKVSEGVVLDYDSEGNLVAIDIDNASQKLDLSQVVTSHIPVKAGRACAISSPCTARISGSARLKNSQLSCNWSFSSRGI